MSSRSERYTSVIRTAMDGGPEVIHELWQDYCDHSAAGLSQGASWQLGVLKDVSNYPPVVLKEAESRFSVADLSGSFTKPSGFDQGRGIVTWLISREVRMEFHRPDSSTVIKLSKPRRTEMRFPWQMVLAANEYLKSSGGKLLDSRYVSLANTTAYEMSYEVPFALSLRRADLLTQLGRTEVAMITAPRSLVRVLLESEALDEEKRTFDDFVRSLT